ncbi:hypothetical protein ABPG75_006190 [Micractinium tetrahymenae]
MPAPQTEAQTARAAAAAAAALLAAAASPLPPATSLAAASERAEQLAAAAACLEAQQARASGEAARLSERRAALRAQLAGRCDEAEAQHEAVAAALQALAARLACFAGGSGGEVAPLLGADLPDGYASACQTLLDSLAGYLQHNFLAAGSSGSSSAAADARAAALELEQLQGCLIKSERMRVEEEAELERLQAELEVLRAPAATAGAASLGYSGADLQAEVASLERRRDASLQAAVAQAEAAAAAAAGAEAVQEQAVLRRAALEQRVHAKQQVVFAKLHGLLYSSSSAAESSTASGGTAGGQGDGQALPELELSPPALQQQLAAVAQAEAALSLQANALLEEVIARQRALAERQLAETVLCWFWTHPERLHALAEKQRRQLATYTAA